MTRGKPQHAPSTFLLRRRIAAWAGLLLLLLNAVSVAVVAPRPALASVAKGEQIVICTPSGLRVITLNDDGTPDQQQDSTREGSCPLCLPLNNATSGALPAPVLAALWSLPDLAPVLIVPVLRPDHQHPPATASPERSVSRPRDPPSAG
ncbi:DUF2946 family protein [Insolitispirillum peregrinum]|uniref:DUF2946 domain-containing protein n=1 Tax=Insolitispirillum peregrinum TaxID=80876 RepID=A0A1N7JRB5_9PROT|nr:DUF2946 family protein [Insolitispirillum peregrinum]SIS51883.1 Protein of unknown function [Insolitispirillum peregrinum]